MNTPASTPLVQSRTSCAQNNTPVSARPSSPDLKTRHLARLEALLGCFGFVMERHAAGALLEMTCRVAEELQNLSAIDEANSLVAHVAESATCDPPRSPELNEHPEDLSLQVQYVYRAIRSSLDHFRMAKAIDGLPY